MGKNGPDRPDLSLTVETRMREGEGAVGSGGWVKLDGNGGLDPVPAPLLCNVSAGTWHGH